MKKMFLVFSFLIVLSLACDVSVSVPISIGPTSLPAPTIFQPTLVSSATPTQMPAPATSMPGIVLPTVTQVMFGGDQMVVGPLTFALPPEIAGGAHGVQIPRAEGEDLPYWGTTPGHAIIELESYFLPDTFHQAQIYIFPAEEYALMVPAAFESMHRLNNLYANNGAPIRSEELPAVPFFNAQQVFASNIQPISFQNGKGVRFLTEYSQYPASVNNQDLFYEFQGLTNHPDGSYYIVAILPVRHPALTETSDPGVILPSGGIPYPTMGDPNADFPGYYKAVSGLLDSSTPDVFAPRLDLLDYLIGSMQVNK